MKFICDKCSSKYSIADDKIQKKVLKIKCKKCSHVIIVRDPQARTQAPTSSPSAPHSAPHSASHSATHQGMGYVQAQGSATQHSAVSSATSPFSAHHSQTTQAESRPSYTGHSTLHTAHEGALKLDLSDSVRQEERTVIARISTEWIRQVREEKHEEPVWFMALHGQPHGPVVLSEVLDHIKNGNIQTDTLVWRGGWPEWISAGSATELHEYFVRPVAVPMTPPPVTHHISPSIHEPHSYQPETGYKPSSSHFANVSSQTSAPVAQAKPGQASSFAQAPVSGGRQTPTSSTSGASFLESVVSPTSHRVEQGYNPAEVVHTTTSPAQPAQPAFLAQSSPHHTPHISPEKNLPRGNGSFSQSQGFGQVATRSSTSVPPPSGRANAFPHTRPENLGAFPGTTTPPVSRQQDIAHEKRAIPAVEFVESNAEADFFARPSSEVLASVSSGSHEMLEVALPPIPFMDIPPEELSIDDADILEIRETIKPKWSARLAVAAGLGVIAVLLTLPLLLNSGQTKSNKPNGQLPDPQKWSSEHPQIRLSPKEMEARRRLLERPSTDTRDKPKTSVVEHKKAPTKRRYRPRNGSIRIQEASTPQPRNLSIEEKIRLAFLKKTNEGGSTKKKVEASGNIDSNLQKRLYKELSAQNSRVQYCYNLHLKRDHLEGTITLTLQISPSGRVTDVQVNRFRGLEFTKCLIREIRYKWRFSSFSGSEPVYLESKYDLQVSQ